MELVAPPVRLLVHLRFALEQGEALSAALTAYLDNVDDECAELIRDWWIAYRQGRGEAFVMSQRLNLNRRTILAVLADGLNGEGILNNVKQLEEEFLQQADQDIERFLRSLPLRAMIPLLLFMFPAYLLLFFGPLVYRLLEAF